jgi:catechol-2,3-dioxygenase
MYHLAWEVASIEDLLAMRQRLAQVGALKGSSDHGANKSLYAVDPDGLEFEVMFLVPASEWGDEENEAIVRPLDLNRELARFGSDR